MIEAELEEVHLLGLVAEGDGDALLGIYDRFAPILHSLALAVAGDAGVASTAVARALRRLTGEAGRLVAEGWEVFPWLCLVVRAEALAERGSRSGGRLPGEAERFRNMPSPGSALDPSGLVHLCYFGGLTAREAAALTGWSQPAVLGSVAAALARLAGEAGDSTGCGEERLELLGGAMPPSLLLAGLAIGALEPVEEEALLAHLRSCRRCREGVRCYLRGASCLALALTPTPPPPEVRRELAAEAGEGLVPLPMPPMGITRRMVVGIAAALAVLLSLASWDTLHRRGTGARRAAATARAEAGSGLTVFRSESGKVNGTLAPGPAGAVVSLCGLEAREGVSYHLRAVGQGRVLFVVGPISVVQGCSLVLLPGAGQELDGVELVEKGEGGEKVLARAEVARELSSRGGALRPL